MSLDENLLNELDIDLTELEELPEFVTFPPGVHICKLTTDLAKNEDTGALMVKAKFEYLENVELAKTMNDLEVPKVGSLSSTVFNMDNEFGRGKFRKIFTCVADAVGSTRLPELIRGSQDLTVQVTTSVRRDKKDKDILYTEFVSMQLA